AANLVGDQHVDLSANENARRKHVIVSGLQPGKVASGAGPDIWRLIEIQRARQRRGSKVRGVRGPARPSPRVAEMAAQIETLPIKRVGAGSGLHRQGEARASW